MALSGAFGWSVGTAVAALLSVQPAIAATLPVNISPDPSWRGVKRMLVVTDVVNRTGTVLPQITPESLCARVRQIASTGAPIAVDCVPLGDPRLRAGGSAVLVVQASISDDVPGQRLLLIAIRRADESGLEPGPIYLGSAPRAVPVSADDTQLNGAIRASLGELLPWLENSDLNQQPIIKRGGK